MLGGQSPIVCHVDYLRRAHVRHALLWTVEALFEQPEILGARWDERAVTNNSDIVFANGVFNTRQISSRNRAIGIVSGAEDFRFIRFFAQACLMYVALMCSKQIILYRNHQSRATAIA